jgi:hypothetical protein
METMENYNDPLRSSGARMPDTYCAGAVFKTGQWYALIADGWKTKGIRNETEWIPSGKNCEASALTFGEEFVKNLLQNRSKGGDESLKPPPAVSLDENNLSDAAVTMEVNEKARETQSNDEATEQSQRPFRDSTNAVWVGVDGGVSGAVAALFPDGTWNTYPVAVGRWNQDRVLDIDGNAKILELITSKAGGSAIVFVAYERARKNKKFGIYNLFQIGRHDEFWRVFLTLRNMQFCDVDPRTWQSFCWGARGKGNTKLRALAYVRQRFPKCDWLRNFNQEQRKGIVDAMCIALWAAAIKGCQPVTQGA